MSKLRFAWFILAAVSATFLLVGAATDLVEVFGSLVLMNLGIGSFGNLQIEFISLMGLAVMKLVGVLIILYLEDQIPIQDSAN